MDNFSVQPPVRTPQATNAQAPTGPQLADPYAPAQQQTSPQPAPDLNKTVSDGVMADPATIAQAISNTNGDPTKAHYENGELKAGDPGSFI